MGNYGVKLVECLKGFLVSPHLQIDEAEVVNGFDTVCFYPDGFEVKLLRHLELAFYEEAVALIHQRLGIVSIVRVGEIGIFIRLFRADRWA